MVRPVKLHGLETELGGLKKCCLFFLSKRCIILGLSALTEMIWKWTDEGSLCSRILMLELPSRRSRGQAFF